MLTTLSTHDITILRDLAARVRELAEREANQELVRRWYAHDAMASERPLVLTETDAGIKLLIPDFAPRCEDAWARAWETKLATTIAHTELIGDDDPVAPWIDLAWPLAVSNYGVEVGYTHPDNDGQRGAYHIEHPLTDLERDIDKLRPRTFAVDRARAAEEKARLEEIFDGLLGVRMRGNPWWTLGLTWEGIKLIGLENLMIYMYEAPEVLHQLLAFLRDEHLRFVDWLEAEGLLNLNNAHDYIGSGSRGYTRALPATDWQPGSPVRSRDLWTLLESQETVGVGPDLYAEFIFPYERSIAERFGGVYYGCCEPVHSRWEVLKDMPNLRRVSVSPWCDEAFMAQALGTRYIYSRKPNPSLVSTALFQEEAIRADLRATLAHTRAHGCTVEIVMKDVHTLHNEPGRLARWVRLAREEIERMW